MWTMNLDARSRLQLRAWLRMAFSFVALLLLLTLWSTAPFIIRQGQIKQSVALSAPAFGNILKSLAQQSDPDDFVPVVNGSFEDGPDPGGFTIYYAGATDIPGWTVTQGSIDYVGTYWQPGDGARSIDLN